MLKPLKPVGVRILQLRDGQCRWPVDNKEPPERFCAAPTVSKASWCEAHNRRAHTAARTADRRAVS
jgi:hypothetical protein